MPYRRVSDPKEVVVIFKYRLRKGADEAAYEATSRRMHELVEAMPGFMSIKGFVGEDGEAIDLIRFRDETSLESWRNAPEHREAQRRGREEFYDWYWIQALRVVREYEFRIDPDAVSKAEPGRA